MFQAISIVGIGRSLSVQEVFVSFLKLKVPVCKVYYTLHTGTFNAGHLKRETNTIGYQVECFVCSQYPKQRSTFSNLRHASLGRNVKNTLKKFEVKILYSD